jgi:hypothetical protein
LVGPEKSPSGTRLACSGFDKAHASASYAEPDNTQIAQSLLDGEDSTEDKIMKMPLIMKLTLLLFALSLSACTTVHKVNIDAIEANKIKLSQLVLLK